MANQLFIDMINSRLQTSQAQRMDTIMRDKQHKAEVRLYRAWLETELEWHEDGILTTECDAARANIKRFVRTSAGRSALSSMSVDAFVQEHWHHGWPFVVISDAGDIGYPATPFDEDRSDDYDPAYGPGCYGVEGGDMPWLDDDTEQALSAEPVPTCACGLHCGSICHDAQVALMEIADEAQRIADWEAFVEDQVPVEMLSSLLITVREESPLTDEIPF